MAERARRDDRALREPDAVREHLIAHAPDQVLSAGGLTARIGCVPLFRRAGNGILRQAIRLALRSETELGEVTFVARRGDAELDRISAPVGGGEATRYLLVPEVDEPTAVAIEVGGATPEPVRATVTVTPQRKWEVFLIHHSHLDIGYTDPQGLVLRQQLAYLDAALDLARAADDWPDETRFRWNVEVTWPLRHWLAARPAADREELLRRVREGRIEVNALPFSMHTEVYSIDELARQLWFADDLRERYGLEIVSAMQTDVPGATVGLLNLLTDAGIRYLSVAHNYAGRSVPHLVGGQELTRPFWWRAASGKRLLVWYTDTPHGVAYMEGNLLGLATDYDAARGSLPEYLRALAERPYPYDTLGHWWRLPADMELTKRPYPYDLLHLRVQSVIADNAAPSLVPAEIARRWNKQWAYPRLRAATNRQFFEAIEARYGDDFATFAGDWTDWWADGIGSAARLLGFNRQAQATVRTAQTLHAVADALTGERDPVAAAEADRVYDEMALFDEHTWGAGNPWNDALERFDSGGLQWARKAAFALAADEGAGALLEAASHRVARLVGTAGGALGSVAVFNPNGWSRTDLVRVFVPAGRIALDQPLGVVDAARGEAVPCVVTPQAHPAHRDRGRFVTFLARDVPPLGYARYDLVAGNGHADATARAASNTVDNEHYRVEVDPVGGRIASIVDKATGRELVDGAAPFGFNQYVYDRYTSAPHFNHLSGRIEATDLALLGSRTTGAYGVVTERSATPLWDRLTMRMTGQGAEWVETTLTLPRGVKRIEIANRLQKIATPDKESVYFAFPFALADPTIEYEITGGVSGPAAPHVPGSANHMRAIRHWLTLADDTTAVAWATREAPLVELGNIFLPYAPFPPTIPAASARCATVYSWALNNLWDTNFPAEQGGEMTFRYAIATGAGDAPRKLGLRTAAALTAPLVGIFAAPGADRDPPARGSFCAIDHPLVEAVLLGRSRRGHDLVLALQSLAPESIETRVSFPDLPVRRAWLGTFLEREEQEVPLAEGGAVVRLAPGAYVALGLELAPLAPLGAART